MSKYKTASAVLAAITDILWPPEDPDQEWDSETLDQVAGELAEFNTAEEERRAMAALLTEQASPEGMDLTDMVKLVCAKQADAINTAGMSARVHLLLDTWEPAAIADMIGEHEPVAVPSSASLRGFIEKARAAAELQAVQRAAEIQSFKTAIAAMTALLRAHEVRLPEFLLPAEWAARGHATTTGLGVVVYRSSEDGAFFDFDHCCPGGGTAGAYWPMEAMKSRLADAGYWTEAINSEASAVYRLASTEEE